MANSFGYICDFNDDFEHQRHITTFSSAFRRIRNKKGLNKNKEKGVKNEK